MSEPVIVTCPNCATRNRIRAARSGTPRCSVCHTELPWIVESNAASFDEDIRASMLVLVDFWAPWCGPCRMVSPVVERVAGSLAGRLKAVKLNVDDAPAISARYGIQGIPLLVLHRDGREVDRLTGAVPEADLRRWLEPQLVQAGPRATAGQ
jgi:thioredoxin 2